ncbi:MAG: hypothetical protein OZ928_14665 [Polyangiaceae bacterium]|nr:hypothetical protein [Polyangiaceae bacterium]
MARGRAEPSLPAFLKYRLGACLVGLGLLGAAPARAESPERADDDAPKRYSAWQSDRATPFVSLATDLGIVYARPRLTIGYGAPFWNYVGLEVTAFTTNSFAQPSIGWRASLPFLDVILTGREVYPYRRRFPTPKEHYDWRDIHLDTGGRRSVYRAIDLEVGAVAPVLHGGVFLNARPVVVDAPPDSPLYEEVLRAVMVPPFALGLRGGYLYGIGESQDWKVGGMLEYVVLPGRPANVTRAGPVAIVTLAKSLDGFAAFSFVVSSPDSLGIEDGTYAFLGVLHRWAGRF